MDFLVTEAFGQTWLCRRHDFQRHRNAGVPPMDVFDPHCVSVAIVLCEQAPATVLEVSARISLECVGKGPLVVVGPGAKVLLMERRVESPCRITVLPGQTVVVEAPTLGQRTILATPKGWMPPVPFGAANCQSIRPGQKLISQSEGKERKDLRLDSELLAFNKVLRVIGGENLPEKWTVLADSDRRGIRLVSDQMVEGLPGLSTSRPCIVGTCQLTPDGTLIIHGPDGPTIGGYAQVGQLITPDRRVVAQLRPGDEVSIASVSIDEALEIGRQHGAEQNKWVQQIRMACE